MSRSTASPSILRKTETEPVGEGHDPPDQVGWLPGIMRGIKLRRFLTSFTSVLAGQSNWLVGGVMTPPYRRVSVKKFFEKPRKKCLTFLLLRANISKSSRIRHNIRVWRSLVSRLNGVQEAAGSNPVTRTIRFRHYRCELLKVQHLWCLFVF